MGETAGQAPLSELERADSCEPDSDTLDAAIEVVCRFSRCGNYPKTTPEMKALARDLIAASDATQIAMQSIAQRWAERSAFCPCASELLETATEIRTQLVQRDQAKRDAETRRQWVRDSGGVLQDVQPDTAAVNDAQGREAQMWRDLKRELKMATGKWPSWAECAVAARKLGYPDFAAAWERSPA